MKLEGKRVKIFFKTGQIVEGLVHSWSSQTSVLGSSPDDCLLIYDTIHNVMMVQVLPTNKSVTNIPTPRLAPVSYESPENPLPSRSDSVDLSLRASQRASYADQQRRNQQAMLQKLWEQGPPTIPTEENNYYVNPSFQKPRSLHRP